MHDETVTQKVTKTAQLRYGGNRKPTTKDSAATPEDAITNFQKRQKRYLVRRQHAFSIAAAWIITVPAAAILAGIIYRAMVLVSGI